MTESWQRLDERLPTRACLVSRRVHAFHVTITSTIARLAFQVTQRLHIAFLFCATTRSTHDAENQDDEDQETAGGIRGY